jgi:hypothetical protein
MNTPMSCPRNWLQLVSFRLQPLYPQGNEPQEPTGQYGRHARELVSMDDVEWVKVSPLQGLNSDPLVVETVSTRWAKYPIAAPDGFLRSVRQLLVTASVVPRSPILVTQKKEAPSSSETSVLTRTTWRNIP